MGILGCIFVIIGAIIGAGFASGKEIYSFFYIYGKYGIIGLIFAIFLIGFVVYKTLKLVKKNNVQNYDEFLDLIIGKIKIKNINIKLILNFIINIFLLMGFFVMCAGFASYFTQEIGKTTIIPSIILAIICYVLLSKNLKGLFILNSILIPIITLIIIALGTKIDIASLNINNQTSKTWLVSAILYASYNSITLISILLPMKKYIKNKSDILKISIISSIIISILRHSYTYAFI